MIDIAKKGKRYKVAEDCDIFSRGDIVVALQDDSMPFCVADRNYVKGKPIDAYGAVIRIMLLNELEELDNGEVLALLNSISTTEQL